MYLQHNLQNLIFLFSICFTDNFSHKQVYDGENVPQGIEIVNGCISPVRGKSLEARSSLDKGSNL